MANEVDGVRFPTVAHYLETLPDGVRSYPDAKIRGGLVNAVLKEVRFSDTRGALPDAVCDWIEQPPLQSEWIPQVIARVLLRSLHDEHFKTREAYLNWAYESQRKVLSGPLYKILFLGVSPERLIKMSASRYAHFHVGLSMEILDRSGNTATARLHHPPLLCTPFDHAATLEGFRAGLELAGGREIVSGVADYDDRSALLEFSWR